MNRLYVLVDSSLEAGYGFVQGTHAVGQYFVEGNMEWQNEILVVLACNIEQWRLKLGLLQVPFTPFFEPALGGRLTALAVVNNDRLFKKLKLLKI